MSSAGYCPRILWIDRTGFEFEKKEQPPVWLAMAANEGKWHEKRIVDELRTKGYEITDQQKELVLEEDLFKLVGHIDGIKDKEELLEIKSMSQFQFDRWMRGGFDEFPEYRDQLACYMAGTGLNRAYYVIKNRNSGSIQYYPFVGLPVDMIEIIDKFFNIEMWIAENPGIPYPAEYNPNSYECRWCLNKELCLPQQEDLTPEQESVLDEAAELYREGKQLEAVAKDKVETAKAIFEHHSIATEMPKWKWRGLGISRYQVKARHVEYDAKEYWAMKITDSRKEDDA